MLKVTAWISWIPNSLKHIRHKPSCDFDFKPILMGRKLRHPLRILLLGDGARPRSLFLIQQHNEQRVNHFGSHTLLLTAFCQLSMFCWLWQMYHFSKTQEQVIQRISTDARYSSKQEKVEITFHWWILLEEVQLEGGSQDTRQVHHVSHHLKDWK